MKAADYGIVVDRATVHLDSLIETNQVRGSKESGPDSCGPRKRIKHGANRAFAVGTGYMDKLERFLWLTQCKRQAAHIVEAKLDSSLLRCEKPFDGCVVSGVQLNLRRTTSTVPGNRAMKSAYHATVCDERSGQ